MRQRRCEVDVSICAGMALSYRLLKEIDRLIPAARMGVQKPQAVQERRLIWFCLNGVLQIG